MEVTAVCVSLLLLCALWAWGQFLLCCPPLLCIAPLAAVGGPLPGPDLLWLLPSCVTCLLLQVWIGVSSVVYVGEVVVHVQMLVGW